MTYWALNAVFLTVVAVVAVIAVIFNIIADLLYAVLDPRIRVGQ